MYEKYSMRGEVEWQIQHEVKPSAVVAQDPTLSTVLFSTSRLNGALSDLLFCVGRISSSSSSDGFRQKCISKYEEAIVYFPKNTRWSALNIVYR